MPVFSSLRCLLCDKDDCTYAPVASLGCGHAMCTSCLSSLSRAQYHLVATRCPLCRCTIDYGTVNLRGDHTPVRTQRKSQSINAPWNDRYGCEEAIKSSQVRQQELQSISVALSFEE